MDLQPGTMVTPNVRLERLIGKGAMGEVWVAEHLGLQTQVAVKFVLEDRLEPDDPEVLERFTREAAAAAKIKSSHVVQKFDHGVMRNGTPYIVMEYLEGERLDEVLKREERLPLHKVARIVWQTAKALQSAHKLGIVHRDIKPDNIFISLRDDEAHVKVFDFGVAKQVAVPQSAEPGDSAVESPELGITNDGVMIGTPEFMSPEQVMNAKSVDHFADLWALAVVAYISFTGELPFIAEDVGKLCVKLLEVDYVPPTQLVGDLPPELDAWFAKAFDKNRANRFQSARELAHELMRVPGAQGLPDDVRPAQHSLSDMADFSFTDPGIIRAPVPTLSGASAGASVRIVEGTRRRNSVIAAAVGAAVVAALITAFLMSGGSGDTMQPPVDEPHVAAAPAPAADEATTGEVTGGEVATEAASATTTASASAGSSAPARPRPQWRRRRDPGF